MASPDTPSTATRSMPPPSILHRLGAYCAAHPGRVLWRVAVLVVWLIALAVYRGGELADGITVDGSESARASKLLEERFGQDSGVSARLVFVADAGRIDDPANQTAVHDALQRIKARKDVAAVDDPFVAPDQVSSDGHAVFADIRYDPGPPPDEAELTALTDVLHHLPGVRGEVGGVLPEVAADPQGGGEIFGVLAALVILVMVFGSVLAAGVPLLLASASLGVGFAIVLVVANFADVPSLAPQLAAMIGLGVGIDYGLVILSRYRELRDQGLEVDEAVAETTASAGRSVLAAGATVVISISGLAVCGIGLLTMMGVATSICVAASVAANLVVLPAVMSLLGPRLDRRPGRRRDAATRPSRTPRAVRLANAAMRRPVAATVLCLVILGVLAVPAFQLRLGYNDASTAELSSTQRQAFDLITRHFGAGHNGDLVAVAVLSNDPPQFRRSNTTLISDAIAATPGVARVFPPEFGFTGEESKVRFLLDAGPQDPASVATLAKVRASVRQSLVGHDVPVAVGGLTAIREDFSQRVRDRLPWFVLAVVAVSVLLLLFVFRSVVVALKAAVLNLLSIAAAYGIVVATVQWGWGARLLGFPDGTPIDAYVPVFLFAIVFGLSMDYEVFLISRMREAYLRTGDNDLAVAEGIASTAKVITSAALVMIAVFAGFIFGADVVTKTFGVGLTAAVAIDVTLVRMVLLPASMKLLGRANWWWPGRSGSVGR